MKSIIEGVPEESFRVIPPKKNHLTHILSCAGQRLYSTGLGPNSLCDKGHCINDFSVGVINYHIQRKPKEESLYWIISLSRGKQTAGVEAGPGS